MIKRLGLFIQNPHNFNAGTELPKFHVALGPKMRFFALIKAFTFEVHFANRVYENWATSDVIAKISSWIILLYNLKMKGIHGSETYTITLLNILRIALFPVIIHSTYFNHVQRKYLSYPQEIGS